MAFWKGLGVGVIAALLVLAFGGILSAVGVLRPEHFIFTAFIMFGFVAAFNVGIVHYGAAEHFGGGSCTFFIIFTGLMYGVGVLSLTAGTEDLGAEASNALIAATRAPLIACGLTFIIWYLMIGTGIAENVFLTALVPLLCLLLGFFISLGLTALHPVVSIVGAAIVGAGAVVAAIVLRVINGSMID